MRTEGFYTVIFDGCPGVGYCRNEGHDDVGPHERWDIMYYRVFRNMRSVSYTGSSGDNSSLVVVDLMRERQWFPDLSLPKQERP